LLKHLPRMPQFMVERYFKWVYTAMRLLPETPLTAHARLSCIDL
jgi:hypothetical protein